MHTRVVFFDPSLAVGHEFAAREPHANPGISESARSRVIDRAPCEQYEEREPWAGIELAAEQNKHLRLTPTDSTFRN